MRVTTADFIDNFGALSRHALSEPVTITEDGSDRLVVVSAEEYGRLRRRDRRAILIEDLSEEQLALIAGAEVPAEHAWMNGELEGWQP